MLVHRNTGTTPFELVLSHPPPEFTLQHLARRKHAPTVTDRDSFEKLIEVAIARARASLTRAQGRYEADFDKHLRKVTPVKVNDFVFLEMSEAMKSHEKLKQKVAGHFKVLEVGQRTVTLQRGDLVKRVSIDRVSLALAPKTGGVVAKTTPTRNALARKQHSGQTWLFDKILAHRLHTDGTFSFRIKWSGDWAST